MPLRVAIMTDETGWHTRQLQAALRARGASSRCVDLADCRIDTTAAWHGLVIPGFGRELPDAVLVRGIAGGSFEQVTKRLGVLHALREFGVPVYNDARAIERSVDKSMTSLLLHAAAIPTPPTWAIESAVEVQRLVMRESAAGHALVLKPLFGSQGKGLQLIGAVNGVHHALPALDAEYGGLAYLQRFVPPPEKTTGRSRVFSPPRGAAAFAPPGGIPEATHDAADPCRSRRHATCARCRGCSPTPRRARTERGRSCRSRSPRL